MNRVQANAGAAGFASAVLLTVLFLFFATSGLTVQDFMDPAKALPALTQKSSTFAGIGVVGPLATAFGLIFFAGLFYRLRDKAPTRAAAVLIFAVVGLTAHALGAVAVWKGGEVIAAVKDQVAATHAWSALVAVDSAFDSVGNGFTGAAVALAGWAAVRTGALSGASGWLGVIAGVLSILVVFTTADVVFLGSIVLLIVWLAWSGFQMRRPM